MDGGQRQWLGKRRIADRASLRQETRAWNRRMNRDRVPIQWEFTPKKARHTFGYAIMRSRHLGVFGWSPKIAETETTQILDPLLDCAQLVSDFLYRPTRRQGPLVAASVSTPAKYHLPTYQCNSESGPRPGQWKRGSRPAAARRFRADRLNLLFFWVK
jgi:hypothetical protein